MAKGKKKPTPLSRIPASRADVSNAREQGIVDGCRIAVAMMFTVLKDKENMNNEDLLRIWKATENLADSVRKRYVNVEDLVGVLREEYDIELWKR